VCFPLSSARTSWGSEYSYIYSKRRLVRLPGWLTHSLGLSHAHCCCWILILICEKLSTVCMSRLFFTVFIIVMCVCFCVFAMFEMCYCCWTQLTVFHTSCSLIRAFSLWDVWVAILQHDKNMSVCQSPFKYLPCSSATPEKITKELFVSSFNIDFRTSSLTFCVVRMAVD